ncbi:hypothetical protein CsSME_00035899 [Camellia sinensis var. sinensis]
MLVRGLPWVCHLIFHIQQCLHLKLPYLNIPITHSSLPLSYILSCPDILPQAMAIYWTPPGYHFHIGQSYHVDPLITHDFHIEREGGRGEGQVHAPTRGTDRGRGRGSRRGQGCGVSRGQGRDRAIDHDSSTVNKGISQLSTVCETLPDVVSNISTAPIGDGQPPSP